MASAQDGTSVNALGTGKPRRLKEWAADAGWRFPPGTRSELALILDQAAAESQWTREKALCWLEREIGMVLFASKRPKSLTPKQAMSELNEMHAAIGAALRDLRRVSPSVSRSLSLMEDGELEGPVQRSIRELSALRRRMLVLERELNESKPDDLLGTPVSAYIAGGGGGRKVAEEANHLARACAKAFLMATGLEPTRSVEVLPKTGRSRGESGPFRDFLSACLNAPATVGETDASPRTLGELLGDPSTDHLVRVAKRRPGSGVN